MFLTKNTVTDEGGGLSPFAAPALPPVIDREALRRANATLQKYKAGKANLEKRIIDNEQWYKLRHWQQLPGGGDRTVQPTSAWLFNAIANKHADAMDQYPTVTVLPREESDTAEAEMLSHILPVILEQNDFEKTYDEVWSYKLKTGTGVYGIFWDPAKLNGLGDISIEKIDLINLFWESGITDIQSSPNLFHVVLTDNEQLAREYPFLAGKLGGSTVDLARYVYDDTVDTAGKSAVIDWYYKKRNADGRTVLHYCKYVNETVLFATENLPAFAERGLYDHGRYPFELDPLFRVEGTPAGFGYLDIGKSAQEYIDRGNQVLMQNMLANARPRHFIRRDGAVDEKEYADMNNDFIHVDGNLGQDSILPVQGKPLNSIYVTLINNKIEELKEVTGNRDISTGGTSGGVTAASAIAAMQEAGSKLSRNANRQSYRVFRQLCLVCIELIRQFYTLPRCFRILGPDGTARYVQYSAERLAPVSQGAAFGLPLGLRMPLFDVTVASQKQSPYSKISQNELALQLYNAGFFNPGNTDAALACLNMMDFDRKAAVMQRVARDGDSYTRAARAEARVAALQAANAALQARLTVLDSQTAAEQPAELAAAMNAAATNTAAVNAAEKLAAAQSPPAPAADQSEAAPNSAPQKPKAAKLAAVAETLTPPEPEAMQNARRTVAESVKP